MAALVIPIAASANDGSWVDSSPDFLNDTEKLVGLSENPPEALHHWLRFSVPIPRRRTITNAFLRYHGQGGSTSVTVDATIKADLADDAPNPATFADALSRFNNGSVATSWTFTQSAAEGEVTDTPDLVATIQPVINQGGWVAKNHMTFYVFANSPTGNGTAWKSYDWTATVSEPPELCITFHTPQMNQAMVIG